MDASQLERLVIDDKENGLFKVNRQVFTSDDILALEKREMFERSWLYAAHESELPEVGSFVTRKVGGKLLIFARGRDGEIRAFFNACTHRGNVVCREKFGTTQKFSCFYHAWAFDLKGALVGLPGPESYAPAFNKSEMGLQAVPRLDIYRGLIFVSCDKNIVSLNEYLGNVREQLDYLLDFAGEEDLVLAQNPSQAYCIKANWKLLLENTIDPYHFGPTHNRFLTHFAAMGMDLSKSKFVNKVGGKGIIDLGHGHITVYGPILDLGLPDTAKEELARIHENLVDKFGSERAERIEGYQRQTLVFPNTFFVNSSNQIRTFYPVSPDYMEVDVWQLVPRHEHAELRKKRKENYLTFLGPAGFGSPDDIAALEGCQEGFRILPDAWTDNSRGMKRAVPDTLDELQMRIFWRRWHALIRGMRAPVDCSDRVDAVAAAE